MRNLPALFSLIVGFWAALTSSGQAASLQENLADFGNSLTKTVSGGREIQLYHWTYLSSVLAGKDQGMPVWPNDDRVLSYLGYLRDQTFRTGNGSGVAGPGIYAAIDPIATCNYGGCFGAGYPAGILVQFVLTPGVRFLDGTASQRSFSPELAKQVGQAGCYASDLVSLFSSASNAACRALRDQLILLTGASALRYPYPASSFSNCPNRQSAAFVLFGDEAIHWDRVVDFTGTLPSSDDGHFENRLIIEALFATQGGYSAGTPWQSLSGQSPRFTDLSTWMRQNLMGCGDWPEDR